MMKPTINNNGTPRKELVEQRLKTMRAITAAMAALQDTKPHGRDYMGNTEQLAADTKLYQERFALLDKLNNEIQDEALSIHREDI